MSPDFWRGFWDGLALGPLWRWIARRGRPRVIEIQTERGWERLLAQSRFIRTAGRVTTAEVMEDGCMSSFRALLDAAGRSACFRIDGREALCTVALSPAPLLEPGKVAFRHLMLTKSA